MWVRTTDKIPRGFWHLVVGKDRTACGYLEAKDVDISVEAAMEKPDNDVCGFCVNAYNGVDPVFGNSVMYSPLTNRQGRARPKHADRGTTHVAVRNFG